MKKILISIGVILLIAVSVSLTIKSRTNNSLFDANVEALASMEEPSLNFICDPGAPVIYCERICLHCFRNWITDGQSGRFVRSIDNCVCGANLNY